MKKNLSIIIIHWNTPDSLKKLLTLLKFSKDYQIIVNDNASDENLEWLKKDFPEVELRENKYNRGYAFACNQGVIKAVGGWLLFLNPDVEISPQQIKKMLDYAKSNKLDACSVKTNRTYHKPLPSWLSLLVEFTPMNRFIGLNIFKVKTLFGGCLLIKKDILLTLGGWDERFFFWFEDSDLTFRLVKNNYKIGWISISIKHSGGESFKNFDQQYKKDIFFHSMDVFARKHFSLFSRLLVSFIKSRYTTRKLLPEIINGVSLIIPNLKKELLEIFLKNNERFLSTSGVEWIVVTSSIKTINIWAWRRQYPEVRFIPIKKNYGFSESTNIGIRVSAGQWIGTINDDVILSQSWLKECKACFNYSIGSVNPVIYTNDNRIESAGISILKKGKAVAITQLPSRHDRNEMVQNNCREVDATNAAAVIYSKEALNKVGLFDEKFGTYLEDMDLSLRLKREGFKNVVSTTAKVIHLGQSSSKYLGIKKQFYDLRNWIYLILKNWSLKDLVFNFPAIIIERVRNISGVIKALIN